MTTLILAHRRISSSLPLARWIFVRERLAFVFESPVLTGTAMTVLILGAIVYIGMLLMSFDMGVRMRDISAETSRHSDTVKRMVLLEREREAGFASRHQAALKSMQEISQLKYLTPGSTAVSEARGDTRSHQ